VGIRQVIKEEDAKIKEMEMRLFPTNFNEFKASKYYLLPSMLKKYQGFLPSA
jgi:hypothetical protein